MAPILRLSSGTPGCSSCQRATGIITNRPAPAKRFLGMAETGKLPVARNPFRVPGHCRRRWRYPEGAPPYGGWAAEKLRTLRQVLSRVRPGGRAMRPYAYGTRAGRSQSLAAKRTRDQDLPERKKLLTSPWVCTPCPPPAWRVGHRSGTFEALRAAQDSPFARLRIHPSRGSGFTLHCVQDLRACLTKNGGATNASPHSVSRRLLST